MATKSILKTVDIRTERSAKRLANALEHAKGKVRSQLSTLDLSIPPRRRTFVSSSDWGLKHNAGLCGSKPEAYA